MNCLGWQIFLDILLCNDSESKPRTECFLFHVLKPQLHQQWIQILRGFKIGPYSFGKQLPFSYINCVSAVVQRICTDYEWFIKDILSDKATFQNSILLETRLKQIDDRI